MFSIPPFIAAGWMLAREAIRPRRLVEMIDPVLAVVCAASILTFGVCCAFWIRIERFRAISIPLRIGFAILWILASSISAIAGAYAVSRVVPLLKKFGF